ncbi:MAG: hypothetical protein ACRDYX_00510 [Egibacteraceae bacterium]
MTVDEALQLLESCRADAGDDPILTLEKMVCLYTELQPEQRSAIHEALRGWVTSDDRSKRDDALFLIHRLRDLSLTDEEHHQLDGLVAESYWGLWKTHDSG